MKTSKVLRTKGLAGISAIQGFATHPRFGHRTRIHLHKWAVRDSLSNHQTIPLTHDADRSVRDSLPILGIGGDGMEFWEAREEMTVQTHFSLDLPVTLLECESEGVLPRDC